MPAELSLDEIYSGQQGDPWKIDPNVQQARDAESAKIIQSEIKDPRNVAVKGSLEKELAHRAPGAKPAQAEEISLDEIYGKAETAPVKGKPAPTEKPKSTSYWDKVKGTGKQLAKEAAQVGDLITGAPAAAAGTIGEVILRADLARQGVNHKASAQTGREFREEITQKGSPTWFTDLVGKFTPPDETPNETHISKALTWLQQRIDRGGDAVEKATGGVVDTNDVSAFVNGAMNALGLKATMKGGRLATDLVKDKLAKKVEPVEAKEGATPDPEHTPMSPANTPREMTPQEVHEVQKAWTNHVEKTAQAKAEAASNAKTAELAERPINKTAPAEAGKVSFEQLKTMGGLALGFTAGAYLDEENPIVGGVLGGVFGGSIGAGAIGGGKALIEQLRSGDSRVRINAITEARQHEQLQGTRATWQAARGVVEALPNKADRIEVFRAIDEGKVDTLTGEKRKVAEAARKFLDEVGEAATKEGVIDALRENYVTHFWDKADHEAVRGILDGGNLGGSMGTKSAFNNARSFASMAEGKKAGLVPKTEDLAEVISMYGNSVTHTIGNKRMMERLRTATTPAGDLLIRPSGKAPGNYVAINHPTLARVKVHPDIAPSLRFMFEQQDAHGLMAGISALNTALKRNAVSFSLFHAKALADAMLGAVNNPLTVGKVVAQAALPKIFGRNKYLKQLREGGAGDLVSDAQKHGVMFTYEGMESVDSDVGGGFYKTMKGVEQMLDKKLGPVGSLPVRAYMRINHAFDNFMWARLHTAMKLEVYAVKREALMENSARAKQPLSVDEAGKIAADYANTIFGGLNWQRMAESANTRFGRDLALSAFSPKGRRGLQLLMFAPDWTLSTSMAFTKAFGQGTGIKGLFGARTAADLYRQQLARSAFYYLTIGNALNVHFSGHNLWENKDPTYVDLGDGRKMQLSKHFMEPFHWLDRPGQQALNKMGQIPSEAMEQIEGKEYLSTKGAPPIKDRLAHLGKKLLPIGAGQFQNGPGPGVAGALGFPIYGKTEEQKRAERKAKREEAFKKRMQLYQQQTGVGQQEPQK